MNAFYRLRTAAGLTQEQVSEILEVPASVVATYETGTGKPTAREVQILRGLSYVANVSGSGEGQTPFTTAASEETPSNESQGREAFVPSVAFQSTDTMATLAPPRTIDQVRLIASSELDPDNRAVRGQFMTPSAVADYMASLFQCWPSRVKLLDPGAGIGSLTEAFMREWLRRAPARSEIEITAYEIEPVLLDFLSRHLNKLVDRSGHGNRKASVEIVARDFITEAAFGLSLGGPHFSHVILNPPYRKISATSEYRRLLSTAGIETGNLYAAFLALSIGLCTHGGEVVAIIPRSFCNGTYFRSFRKWLLARAAITHIHVFESRKKAFQDDDVLQENIIIRLSRGAPQGDVTISTSYDASFGNRLEQTVPFAQIVRPSDEENFIRIPFHEPDAGSALFSHSLSDLGLDVATGPVVDFRLRDHWLPHPTKDSVPLLYAHHFSRNDFQWPREHRKPNALSFNSETKKWLMPRGWYALTKRFSSKEERRRVVAYVVDPERLPGPLYGFENHLNVIHSGRQGLGEDLARGVALFLNSTLVDAHFRTFSGHTQVNATDLRAMRFPSMEKLLCFGKWAKGIEVPTQERIDQFIESHNGD